jgi:hypothetical protein
VPTVIVYVIPVVKVAVFVNKPPAPPPPPEAPPPPPPATTKYVAEKLTIAAGIKVPDPVNL